MKKTLLLASLFFGATLFGLEPADKLDVQQMCDRMESMRNFEWNGNKHQIVSYIYPLYYTATANPQQALEIEKKIASEFAGGQGNLRYKMLLAQSLEISGVQQSAEAIADVILKGAKDAENVGWSQRAITAIGSAKDPNANKALLKILATGSKPLKLSAMTALGERKAGLPQIAGILNSQIKSGFKDKDFTYAAIASLGNFGGENALKGLVMAYKGAKADPIKLAAASAYFTAASKLKAPSAAADAFAAEILADKSANLGSKLDAYAHLIRMGKASKPASRDFELLAIDVLRNNPKLAIPSFLNLKNMDESVQTMFVQMLTDRGTGYEEIIKLNPKTPELAEAIARAAAKMGTQKDYAKLMSFAPLFKDKRSMRQISIYIADVNGTGKTLALSAFQKGGDAMVSDLVAATLENLDSSSAADELLKQIKSGDASAQQNAIKTLASAQEKAAEIFVALCEIYPTITDSSTLSAMQRLMVSQSRLLCTDAMLKAAIARFDAAKDNKTKAFFMRFAAENGSDIAAKFLAKAYSQGLKNEALREFAKWKNADAFDSLLALEKANPSDKAKIREVVVSILVAHNMAGSKVAKYISSTAINEREKNLETMLEVPNFGSDFVTVKDGIKLNTNSNKNELKRALDGEIRTRWSSDGSRMPGMGFMIMLPAPESVKAVELLLGNSRNDRVLDPKVYVGTDPTNLHRANFKYSKDEGKDIIAFAKPEKISVICIVNTKEAGGNWSIHEINVQK